MRLRALLLALCLGATAVGARAADAPVIGVPACTGLELAPEPWTHREYGRDIPGVALRNTSLRTCRVAGFPAVRFYLTTGKLARVKVVQKYLLDNRTYTYVIVPGNSAFFAMYGQPPNGEFDRSCQGFSQADIKLPANARWIQLDLNSGTCGGIMTVSQIFPIDDLSLGSDHQYQY
jgi:hypothetical protein